MAQCHHQRRTHSGLAVRAVGTNTLRVAKNSSAFLKQAQAALGFPIEVVAGREEARLIARREPNERLVIFANDVMQIKFQHGSFRRGTQHRR
jgi:hypothetical protein